jgi:uncharacterized phage-associated protein
MAKAIDIARYLILLAGAEDEPQRLTHLQLQKLLYYVQGWSLALRDRAAFQERIEAWAHGPVVVALWPQFTSYGRQPIPPSQGANKGLAKDTRELVSAVWGSYKGHSAIGLREMTHKEQPWIKARKGLSEAQRGTEEITRESMKAFFSKIAND